MKWILFSLLALISCGTNYVCDVVTNQGTILELDSARFEIPDNAVKESLFIEVEKQSVPKSIYAQGYRTLGTSYTIKPFDISLEKPIVFTIPVKSPYVKLGAKINRGFVPLANSYVEDETLYAQLWHGGEYYVIKKPEEYGIINHTDTDSALLIVTDPYVSDYTEHVTRVLRQNGYKAPVWIFVYDPERSIEDNAFFLSDELSKLHELYGDFRLDIVSFGLGGLVFHRYVADTALYQRDISSSVLAVGTPFKGSELYTHENVNLTENKSRYFYIDALADNVQDISPESDFITWVKKNRSIVGGYYYDDVQENKNFASIRGNITFTGDVSAEREGDGLVSLDAGMLTAIEPEPLPFDHFNLFENRTAHQYIADFTILYRTFSWPMLFEKVWHEEETMSVVTKVWVKEAQLNYRDIGVELLLQWNENMLNSAPSNALLITNGDNDTYPAWYLQKQGIRTDVTIVNRSLLNIKEYTQYLMKHEDLPLELTSEELDGIKFKKDGETIVTVSDQLLMLLVKNRRRPVVFSTTVYNPEKYDLPLKLVGVVYEIGEGETKVEDKYVDIEKTWGLFQNTFKFDKYLAADSISPLIRNMYRNFAGSLLWLHMALIQQERYDEALQVLRYLRDLQSDDEMLALIIIKEALTYDELGMIDKADSLFHEARAMKNVQVADKKMIAMTYHEWGRITEAITVLAECLQEEPENQEILDLITRYQEEL